MYYNGFHTLIALLIESVLWSDTAVRAEHNLCCSTMQVQHCSYLRSAAHLVPHSWTFTRQHCVFPVTGPVTWNGLPTTIRQIPVGHSTSFFSTLTTILFD